MADNLLPDLSDPRILAGFGVGGALLYKIWRILKTDRREDKQGASLDKYYGDLVKEVGELRTRADTFAAERNKAIADAAAMKAQVEILTKTLGEAQAKMVDIETLLKTLTQENSVLRARAEVFELQLAHRPPS